jgi:hypothetical protein
MSEISKERKDEIRQSEDYKKARKILDPLYYNIVVMKRKIVFNERGTALGKLRYHPNYADFRNNCHEFETRWEEANKVSKILRGLKTARYPNPEYESMSKMLSYLGLVESLGVTLADAILILLIANERAVHTKGLTKHVTKVRELEDVDLGYKLHFLEVEGFAIFKKFINKTTRNDMAHLKFTINENGEIRRRDGNPIHINNDIRNFWDGVDVLRLVFEDVDLLSWFTGENPFSIKNQRKE